MGQALSLASGAAKASMAAARVFQLIDAEPTIKWQETGGTKPVSTDFGVADLTGMV